jgi:hypothetical protein
MVVSKTPSRLEEKASSAFLRERQKEKLRKLKIVDNENMDDFESLKKRLARWTDW